jgi:hypothetical protein
MEGDTVRVPFQALDAARNCAQAMRALNCTTTLAVKNGFWIVTVYKTREP